MRQEAILEGLNEPQRQAVTQVNGPVLVIAGAGSGKTRVITRRVAWLIDQGVPPWSILAITFTNKAAGEMRSRVADAMGRRLHDFGRLIHDGPTICTFHSLGLRILKEYATPLGLKPNFSILDVPDQLKLVKEAIGECERSTQNLSPSQCHSMISASKNRLITAEAYAQGQSGFVERKIAPIYARYEALLRKNNAVDFDDLLMLTALGFKRHPPMLQELQDRFEYLLIDEYQDTNHAQYIIAHALAHRHRNLCVVGDPDQSIYAWRGADIRNILDFEKDYTDARVIRLEQNYRSTQRILVIASRLIERNTQRKAKALWTENPQGSKARLLSCADERDEATQVMRELRRHRQQGMSWSDMAIFYRINAMSRVMEEALFREQIPYEVARGVEFYGRKEIKDVLAYLRVIVNPLDEVSLLRIINTPTRGLGESSIRLLQAYAVAAGLSLYEVLSRPEEAGLSKRAAPRAKGLAILFDQWRHSASVGRAEVAELSIQQIIEKVVRESGLEDFHGRNADDDIEGGALDNIGELISAAADFEEQNPQATLEAWLHSVSLVSDADHRGREGAVTLMTLHAAKGLEFPLVAIIGMEEGILPHERVKDDPSQIEEERRLCFVGVTRAQQQLILSHARDRNVRGMRNRQACSPFVFEMPSDQIERVESPALEQTWQRQDAWRAPREPSAVVEANVRRGQRVQHLTFGVGTVLDVSAMNGGTRVVVNFDRAGRKTLIWEFARLSVLDD